MKYYSAIKRNEISPFATTWMVLEVIMLSEISDTEKDKYCVFTYMCNLKNKTNERIYQNRNELTDTENKLVVTRGERGGRTGKQVKGIKRHKLLGTK